MPEDIKPTLTAPLDIKTVETKTADKPVETAAKATVETKSVVEDKAKPAETKATDKPVDQKPAEELKSLLDEASEVEVKLDKDGKPIEEAKKVVPEKYEFKLPEGTTLADEQMKIVQEKFKKWGFDNITAQEAVDLQVQLTKANEDTHVKAWEAYLENQKTEAKTYFGIKLPEVMRNVARARDAFLSKSIQEKLNVAGFANDKDFLETLDKIGRVIGEGKFVDGKRSAPAKGKPGETMEQHQEVVGLDKVYPSMAKT